jgi:hypothetical protein
MRLPHHLLRHPSGVFHFRLVVPKDLRPAFGKSIKVSMRTKDPLQARTYAYVLGARYAQAISDARGGHMGSNDRRISGFEIIPQPDGRYGLKTDGTPQDNEAALRALALLTAAPAAPPAPSQAVLASVHQQLMAAFASAPPTGPTLQEAFDLYVEVEVRNLRPDTWQQRERAIRSFMPHVGQRSGWRR